MSRALSTTLLVSAAMISMVVYAPGHCQALAGLIAFLVTSATTWYAIIRQSTSPALTAEERSAERINALTAALRQLGVGEGPESPSPDVPLKGS